MIAQKTIQEVYDAVKVEDVVQDFVPLKRRGANMIGLCPFHHEKTPSFTVSPAKNLYKCFGCGKGGNAINFVMEHEHFTFPEAVQYLARKYNIEVEEKEMTAEDREAQQMSESLFIINEFAKGYYQSQLFDTGIGRSVGLSYFKDRGFTEETIRNFGLGFAADTKDAFTTHATESGHKIELLQKLGLTSEHGRDFFRNRVMFTIFNLSGKPVAFAGRILVKDVKAPKYINSPESDIYNKSKILYGLFQGKQEIRKLDECILVEGYTDVISLHQAGIENVVASSGTALTQDQLRLIKRFTPNLKILYDGDPAGIKAALRGLDLALEQDLNVKIALLPDNEDPDSYVNKVGAEVFKEWIGENAKDFILFKTDLLLKETAGDPIKKAALIKDIVGSIARIPDPIKRALYIQECSRRLEMEEAALMAEMKNALKLHMKQAQQRADASQPNRAADIARLDDESPEAQPETATELKKKGRPAPGEIHERDIARILVCAGDKWYDEEAGITIADYIFSNIEDVIETFGQNHFGRIVRDYYELSVEKQSISTSYFINHEDKKLAGVAIDLLHTEFEYSLGWEERGIFLRTQKMPELNFGRDSEQALMRFKLKKIVQMCEQNQERLRDMKADSDPTQMQNLLRVQQRLIAMRDEITRQLNTIVLP